jgi:hypothetical protein
VAPPCSGVEVRSCYLGDKKGEYKLGKKELSEGCRQRSTANLCCSYIALLSPFPLFLSLHKKRGGPLGVALLDFKRSCFHTEVPKKKKGGAEVKQNRKTSSVHVCVCVCLCKEKHKEEDKNKKERETAAPADPPPPRKREEGKAAAASCDRLGRAEVICCSCCLRTLPRRRSEDWTLPPPPSPSHQPSPSPSRSTVCAQEDKIWRLCSFSETLGSSRPGTPSCCMPIIPPQVAQV